MSEHASRHRVQVVIPMAGAGQRFTDAGYTTPKPLIPVTKGGVTKAMVKMVADNMRTDAVDLEFIFIVQRPHYEAFGLEQILSEVPGSRVAFVEGLTEGPACTVLAAKGLLNPDVPLLIVNSDQFVEWDAAAFYRKMFTGGRDGKIVDGGILCFDHQLQETKWSYAAHDADGWVSAVAEKKPISTSATVGIYFFRTAALFVADAEAMIASNIRVNNEFYVTPVYDIALARGDAVTAFFCDRMWGTGTPADYEHFLAECTAAI